MKKTTLALLITVFSAGSLFSTVTQAEGPPGQEWHHQGDREGRGGPGDREGRSGHDHGPRGHEGYAPHRHFEERDRFAWQGHEFHRGQPLPPRFRGDDYRVNDWHARGLHEPPRGERWACIDGNYVLIAAATGVITSILLNNAFH